MSVENSEAVANSDGLNQQKLVNGSVNGLSNGHSTSSSPDKQHKSSSSSHKSRHRDHDKSKSSSSKDHKSSSSKSSHRDRDDKNKHSSSSHHKSSNRDKDRDKDKDKEKSSSGSKHHSSSSSNKDKEKSTSSGSKHHSTSTSNGNGVEKHSSSSSGHRDEKKPSSSSHHTSSGSKDEKKSSSSHHTSSRDDKDRKKEHKSSSSSKDKHSSSSGSKHKSKDKDRDRERSSKHHSSSSSSKRKEERKDEIKQEVKQEKLDNSMQAPHCRELSIKCEQVDMSLASSCDYSLSQFRDEETLPVKKEEPIDDDDDDDEEQEENVTHDTDFVAVDGGADSDFDTEDVPLSKRKKIDTDSEDEAPLILRKKVKTEKKPGPAKIKKRPSKMLESDDEEEESADDSEDSEFSQPKKKAKKEVKREVKSAAKPKPSSKNVPTPSPKKGGRKKKEEEEEEVWKWWEEEKLEDGTKWKSLEHKGPLFAPPYEVLPKHVTFEYNGKKMSLSQDAEEIAGFYSKMLDHDYTAKQVFNDNFFKDWRKAMTKEEQKIITDLSKCNFRNYQKHFAEVSEKNKSRSKEQKKQLKEDNEAIIKEYGYCSIDGHKEKIGNFRIEPPGLFRGRGEHPKMGKVKKRIEANDVIINCSKDSKAPVPPKGSRWKEVRHDNTVTWLVSWQENVQGGVKYIMLNPSSKLKGEKDFHKYEVARKLQLSIGKIRATYTDEWKSKEMRIRQRAVALYFIDKLALRAGNEKDEDQADTVGCCSLRVEHIELKKVLGKMENVVVFDFLGKDSIRYYNEVEVEKRVFKNLELFMEGKSKGDDLFDRLNTTVLNEHLKELMDGLSAKVFRTFNASITLQTQLDELTDPKSSVPEKLLSYNRANRAVAILCNHQRAVPKQHDKSMENLKEKIKVKQDLINDVQKELKALKKSSARDAGVYSKKSTQLQRLKEQLSKLEIQETDRDENKTIALGTSKLNYLDPRISVAWCKKYNVPIEKIFNKTQRDKFRWAIEMVDETYRF